jgi:2-phospho-L-lactate guanylyltransferase
VNGGPLRATAFIPVKPLTKVKSRLSGCLDLSRRIQLTYDSLKHVVHILKAVPHIDPIVIISRDPQVMGWADDWGVAHLRERGHSLNAALREARAQYMQATAILIVPSDLVALSTADVKGLLSQAARSGERCVVIAPDRHGSGTNALLLRPPDVIEFGFGPHSAARHARRALAAGVQPIWFRSDSIGLDLDSPDDLELYLRSVATDGPR